MIKKLCITVLISALMFNLSAFAKGNKSMTRQEIADKNLEILFNITTKNNNGADKDFMNRFTNESEDVKIMEKLFNYQQHKNGGR